MNGKLIVFEGIDGAGTEEQSKRLLKFLEEKDIPCVRLEYPDYNGPIGRLIHDFLHKKDDFNEETLALLHSADRIKDRDKIRHFLNEGKVVICDRYFTSTLGFQGANGVPVENLLKIAEMFKIPKPDKIIYLKVSPEISLKRKQGEKPEPDRNESDLELMERVGKFYDELIEKQVWASWFSINGEKPIEQVFEDVKRILRL